jgi:outer membrane protein OmpA-like peptidoglycan-associated protein
MEKRPLPANVTPRSWSPRSWSFSRAFTNALLLGLLPVATAAAQPPPYANVSVTNDRTEIDCFGRRHRVCMTAPQGTVLEVLYIDGDRYNHRNSNWYWVLLPPDQWGRRVSGWIRGDDVEHVQPVARASASQVNLTETPAATDARHEPRETTGPTSVEEVPAPRAFISDVVVNFEFDKSSLTDEARRKLDAAVVSTTSPGQRFAVALEGHADGIGREAYNDQLGSARADTVKRYLMERLGIPAENITVVSYGERQPIAPNKTRQGRAQNRRVALKAGGS